jgi:hypothetical protein
MDLEIEMRIRLLESNLLNRCISDKTFMTTYVLPPFDSTSFGFLISGSSLNITGGVGIVCVIIGCMIGAGGTKGWNDGKGMTGAVETNVVGAGI